MSADWDSSPWSCAGAVAQKSSKAGNVPQEDLSSVPSFVLPPPRSQKNAAKCLKPEKWRAAFDHEGRPAGFQKLLKIIALGGVDHSIRAEVWEFLLGCYALGTTAEYRKELRAARRERYKRLIEQCQHMHPSIGTGTLAYTVGSKVMDVRIMSKDSARKEAKLIHLEVNETSEEKAVLRSTVNDEPGSPVFDMSGEFDETSSGNQVSGGFDSVYKYDAPSYGNAAPVRVDSRHEDLFGMPVTNLFADREETDAREETDTREYTLDDTSTSFGREHLPGQVDSDSVGEIEPGCRSGRDVSSTTPENKPKRLFATDVGPLSWPAGSMKRIKSRLVRDRRKKERAMKIGDSTQGLIQDVHSRQNRKQHGHAYVPVREVPVGSDIVQDPVAALGKNANEERVAEWLWILHRIVVDVVRTDRHLEFYGDAKNMARMSDILAVYAWIDPATGYCQGMSDLLSPFIVLYEDDADAFWCFESLLRRVRQNFQMEGPLGVMKQLEALPKILEVADPQMYRHLSAVGADNYLFAFRMLLVLFRRELSFGESLNLWEMMWAADFNQAMAWALEYNCLDALVLNMPPPFFAPDSLADDTGYHDVSNLSFATQYGFSPRRDYASGDGPLPNSSAIGGNFLGRSPFCGLRPGNLLNKNRQRMQTVSTLLGKTGDEELSVFCVAAILVQNRNKLLKEVQSMDDAIKMFNDMNLTVRVHSSMHTAIKLRKKYRSRVRSSTIGARFSLQ